MTISVITPGWLLAVSLSEYPALSDSIAYQLNGLVVVFSALGMIWLTLELLGLFFKRQRPVPVAVPPAVAGRADDLPAELIAVISAAVHVTLGERHRIATIVAADPTPQDWAREGRRQIHSARKVR